MPQTADLPMKEEQCSLKSFLYEHKNSVDPIHAVSISKSRFPAYRNTF